MTKKTVSGKEILADIKSGMDNTALIQEYGFSDKGLQSVFKKLVDAGILKQEEVDKGTVQPGQSVEVAWKCPACGMPQTKQSDECPDCGVIVAKFKQPPVQGESAKVNLAKAMTTSPALQRDMLSGQFSQQEIMIQYALRSEELEEIGKMLPGSRYLDRESPAQPNNRTGKLYIAVASIGILAIVVILLQPRDLMLR